MQGGSQSFAADYEGDFVHQGFRFPSAGILGAELGELGAEARVGGYVDVGWQGRWRSRGGHVGEDEADLRASGVLD